MWPGCVFKKGHVIFLYTAAKDRWKELCGFKMSQKMLNIYFTWSDITTASYEKKHRILPWHSFNAYLEEVTMWFIIKSCPTDEVPCKSLAGNERMEPHSSSQKKGVCSNLPWKQPLSCVCYWAAHLAHYQLLFFICGSWAWAKYSSGAPRECVCLSVCVWECVCVCVCVCVLFFGHDRTDNCVGSS